MRRIISDEMAVSLDKILKEYSVYSWTENRDSFFFTHIVDGQQYSGHGNVRETIASYIVIINLHQRAGASRTADTYQSRVVIRKSTPVNEKACLKAAIGRTHCQLGEVLKYISREMKVLAEHKKRKAKELAAIEAGVAMINDQTDLDFSRNTGHGRHNNASVTVQATYDAGYSMNFNAKKPETVIAIINLLEAENDEE